MGLRVGSEIRTGSRGPPDSYAAKLGKGKVAREESRGIVGEGLAEGGGGREGGLDKGGGKGNGEAEAA